MEIRVSLIKPKELFLFFYFFYLVSFSEETSFLTTFYGLYFNHHYTHIIHYKSCWTFCVGSYTLLSKFLIKLLHYLPKIILHNNYLPCWDLYPGHPGTKQIANQCATVLWLNQKSKNATIK